MAIKWYKNAVKSGGERYDDGYLAGKMYLFGEKLECGRLHGVDFPACPPC